MKKVLKRVEISYIEIVEEFQIFKSNLENEVTKKISELGDVVKNDSLLPLIEKNFIVTPPNSFNESLEILKHGEIRYRNEIPPGYQDEEDKLGLQKYGDLVSWTQILKYSKEKRKPIVLIINDLKEDWWIYQAKSRSNQPRYELIKEISDYSNVDFWMYDTNTFLHKSKLYINIEIQDETLEEVKQVVRREDTNYSEIPINNLWVLNHWGSDFASIVNGRMIFKGLRTRLETEGCHVNIINGLDVGSIYKVSCFVRSQPNTTGRFQLWCHDNIGIEPNGSEAAIQYAIPSIEGERCSLRFDAKYNKHLRIHRQYTPGEGQIEVDDIRISKLQS